MAKKPTKADYICHLLDLRGPLTRDQLTRGAWVMEGMKIPYKATSNSCYFIPGTRHEDPYGRKHKRRMSSLVYRGLIEVVGKRGHKFLYGLTPAGQRRAEDFINA